ncbi:MAG TPA: hypothetical protein VHG89_01845 [Verrucomicrobiae bacterium]|nr:hypothetical protein [Verrucomicrobiae bacterium]
MLEILRFVLLVCGLCNLLSGIVMIWHLPRYQRQVETGEIKRNPSRPSFKVLWLAAFGLIIGGLLLIALWYSKPF